MQPYLRTYISALGTLRIDGVRYTHPLLCRHRGRLVEIWGRKPVEVYLAGRISEDFLVALHPSDRIA